MKDWLENFLSDFHRAHLKSLGFRKARRTFSREMDVYFERFNFQGSTRNYAGVEDWVFYLNVGIEFKDLEPLANWSLFPHTHWAERIRHVVPGAPQLWKYNLDTDRPALMGELLSYMKDASRAAAVEIEGIRAHYLRGDFSRSYLFQRSPQADG